MALYTPIPAMSTALMRPRRPKQNCLQLPLYSFIHSRVNEPTHEYDWLNEEKNNVLRKNKVKKYDISGLEGNISVQQFQSSCGVLRQH